MADQIFQSGLRAPSNKSQLRKLNFSRPDAAAPKSLANSASAVPSRLTKEHRRASTGTSNPGRRHASPLLRCANE